MVPRSDPRHPQTFLQRLEGVGITRAVLALCLLWVVAIGPIVHDLTAQGAPRMALTGALVDDRAITIDDYLVGFDYTERDGHIYSDKAPGQEVLAVPFYAASRAVGAEPAIVPRVEENLTLWWMTLWSAMVPAIALIAMVATSAHRRGIPIPIPALATLTFGTMLLPFGANLYGHVLGAALGFAAWTVLDRSPLGWRHGAAAGALIGLAVVVEYPMALVGLALAVLMVARRAWSALVAFAVAGIPSAVFLGVYQAAAFGSPFSSGYQHKTYHEDATLLITGIPKLSTFAAMLFGSRGLFLFTPVVAVGIVGLVQRWRHARDEGALVGLGVVTAFFLLQAGWVNAYGGDAPGPRYVIPMLPFLGIGLAHVWRDIPGPVRRFVVGISLASMVLPTITHHIINPGTFLLSGSLRTMAETGPNPTVWSIALGPVGWVVYGLTTAGAGWWAWRTAVAERPPARVAEGAAPVGVRQRN